MNHCQMPHCPRPEWFQGEGLCRHHLLEDLDVVETSTTITTDTTDEPIDEDLAFELKGDR